MDKIQGNYTRQTEFPLDEETLVALQTNQAMIELLGNIAGDKTILYGCGLYNSNTMRYGGYVFVRTAEFPEGEILRYEGGSISAGIYLKKTAIDVNANNVEYAGAYTQRSLAAGIGDESFSWSDFSVLHTNAELKELCSSLQQQIDLLTPPPIGIVQLWAGHIASIPAGYRLCDGGSLNIADYAALYNVIGTQFNTANNYLGNSQITPIGQFRLPDLRGRFIAGYTSEDAEYNTLGKSGGAKKHLLTASESGLPKHKHTYARWNKTGIDMTIQPGNSKWGIYDYTSEEGGTSASSAHENRPPYYVLAYIMRIQ